MYEESTKRNDEKKEKERKKKTKPVTKRHRE
jgi:hypothetical protein